jgi:hypothetical protein
LNVYEDKLLRRVFGVEEEEVVRVWRKFIIKFKNWFIVDISGEIFNGKLQESVNWKHLMERHRRHRRIKTGNI